MQALPPWRANAGSSGSGRHIPRPSCAPELLLASASRESAAFDDHSDSEICDESHGQAEIGDDWEEHEDEQGNLYYFNVRSGCSQWHPPGKSPPLCDGHEEPHMSTSRKRADRRKRVEERLDLPSRQLVRHWNRMERRAAGIPPAPNPDPPSDLSKSKRRRMRKLRELENRHLESNDGQESTDGNLESWKLLERDEEPEMSKAQKRRLRYARAAKANSDAVVADTSTEDVVAKSPLRLNATVWVNKVRSTCNPKLLESAFREVGPVANVETGFPGYAFIEFVEEQDAAKACKSMNKALIKDVGRIYVSMATHRGYTDACVKRDEYTR